MAFAVENFMQQHSDLEPSDGLPLYELVKASRRLKTQRKCFEGMLFFVFAVLFALMVIELRQTSLAGESTEALLDLFVEEEFTLVDEEGLASEVPFFRKSYKDIRTQEEWWLWALGPLLRGLYYNQVGVDTDGQPLFGLNLPQGFGQLYVMGGNDGGVLVRTARVNSSECSANEYVANSVGQKCFARWDPAERDTDPFGLDPDADEIFRFQETSELGTDLQGTFLGQLLFTRNHYGEQSFYADLPANNYRNESQTRLLTMYRNNLLDERTRMVSVEFHVYNPATQVVSAVRLFTEFSQTGLVRSSHRMYHLNAMMWAELGVWYRICGGVFVVLLLWFTARWVQRVLLAPRFQGYVLRWKVFFDLLLLFFFWVAGIIVLYLTVTSPVLLVSRFAETIRRTNYTRNIFEDARDFHYMDALCSINLMLATVKFIGYLPFKTTRTIWATLAGAIKDIVVLGLVVALFWIGFSVGSHLTFGSLGFTDFNRVDRTFGTLMVLMFSGSVDYNGMREVSFWSAPVFYAVYMIFMWGVMLNLFVAIIVLTYERYSDVQQNFDNWAKQNHGAGHGCIVMTYPEVLYHRARHLWFRLRRRRLGHRSAADAKNRPETPVDPESGHFQLDFNRLEADMAAVMKAPAGLQRCALAEQLRMPWRAYFREKARQVIWLLAVRKTRRMLRNFAVEDDFEDSFISKWRKQFDLAKGTSKGSYSLMDWICWCNPGSQNRDGGEDDEDDASQSGTSGTDTKVPPEMRTLEQALSSGRRSVLLEHSRSVSTLHDPARLRVRKIAVLEELIKQESELVKAKMDIEKALRETQALFKRHRISFNRILRLTWNKTTEEERLQAITFGELRELLSPGCLEERTKCKFCKEDEVDARAQTLLDSYTLLKKRRQVFQGNQRRLPRFRRLIMRTDLAADDNRSQTSSFQRPGQYSPLFTRRGPRSPQASR